MTTRILALTAILGLPVLAACSNTKAPAGPNAFVVEIEVSDEAATLLRTTGSEIVAEAAYYGIATPDAVDADAQRRIALGVETKGFDRKLRKLGLTGSAVNDAALAQVVNRRPDVEVTITAKDSQGQKVEDFACGRVVVPVPEAQTTAPRVVCGVVSR